MNQPRTISHIPKSPTTHMNSTCHTYEWVMSHMWMRHVSHNGIPPFGRRGWWVTNNVTYTQASRHTQMSHATRMKDLCLKYERVMFHMWMRPVSHTDTAPFCRRSWWVANYVTHTEEAHHTCVNESCHTDERVMSHIWMRCVPHTVALPFGRRAGWVANHATHTLLWDTHTKEVYLTCTTESLFCVCVGRRAWWVTNHVTHMRWIQLVNSLKW